MSANAAHPHHLLYIPWYISPGTGILLSPPFFLSHNRNRVLEEGGKKVGKNNIPLRLAVLLLCVVVLWHMLGAPRTAEEWQAAPLQFEMAWNQLPARAGRIFSQWALYSAQAEPRKPENNTTDWKKLLDNENTWPIKVWDVASNKLITIPLEQYVAGVVAAEMPASYHLEALKAQAAAARTRAVNQAAAFSGKGCSNHPEADICTDSTHCQAYINESERAEKWGASAQAYEARVFRAVMETKGYILTYNGEPITVLYHAVSGGHTEDVQAVFSQSLPYLKGVESKGEESNPKYQTVQSFSHQEAAELLNKAFPGANISPDTVALQVAITERTATGRAAMVQVGDREVPAKDFRAALSLNSTLFTITATESSITFTEKGYGHGVGMSQAGANAMAAAGSTWQDILKHYYTGIQIAAIPQE
jgi:stage II sporulation protein D